MLIFANESVDSPEYPCPISAESPSPKMVKAKPVATWLDSSICVSTANSDAALAPATGAEFALLPPQNASGNWVKVVQRLPVRLEITDTDKIPNLRAGMSVIVEIDTGRQRDLPPIFGAAFAWMNERL